MNNLQNIKMNNIISYNQTIDPNYLVDKLNILDEDLIKNINNKIISTYNAKLNLINYVLNSEKTNIKNVLRDIKNFYIFLNPLNNEYNLNSYAWDFKVVDNILLIQNSVPKLLANDNFYNNYINKIKNILSNSKIDFMYHEFKVRRYYKSLDIIFSIKLI
jgi:hypothetical protein